MESILTSIKKLLGIAEEYNHFDADIIMHINTALMTLTQLGVGPPEGFMIEDDSEEWTDFLAKDELPKMQAVKTYVYLSVKNVFDTNDSSAVIEARERKIAELEWRLNVSAESIETV